MEYDFDIVGDKLYCKMCGNVVGWKHGEGDDVFWILSSSATEGIAEKGICHDCLIEHCCNTNCLRCDWYRYPNCRYIEVKKIYKED